MNMFNEKSPGMYTLKLPGKIGILEAELSIPDNTNFNYVAMIGHPHSLFGGTMHNKVVTTVVRACNELNIPSLRFNFRGVGESEGAFDGGLGESEDMLQITHQWLNEVPHAKVIFIGFSFGSYVAYRAAAQHAHGLLVTIAPSVENFNYDEFALAPKPWVVIQGDNDEVVPPQAVFDFAKLHALSVLTFSETTHFFHGKLIELKRRLIDTITSLLK